MHLKCLCRSNRETNKRQIKFIEIFPSSIFHTNNNNNHKNTRETWTQKKELEATAVDLAALENYDGKLTQNSIMQTLAYLRSGGDGPGDIRCLLFEVNSHKQMWDRNGKRAMLAYYPVLITSLVQFFSPVLKSDRMVELFIVVLMYFYIKQV